MGEEFRQDVRVLEQLAPFLPQAFDSGQADQILPRGVRRGACAVRDGLAQAVADLLPGIVSGELQSEGIAPVVPVGGVLRVLDLGQPGQGDARHALRQAVRHARRGTSEQGGDLGQPRHERVGPGLPPGKRPVQERRPCGELGLAPVRRDPVPGRLVAIGEEVQHVLVESGLEHEERVEDPSEQPGVLGQEIVLERVEDGCTALGTQRCGEHRPAPRRIEIGRRVQIREERRPPFAVAALEVAPREQTDRLQPPQRFTGARQNGGGLARARGEPAGDQPVLVHVMGEADGVRARDRTDRTLLEEGAEPFGIERRTRDRTLGRVEQPLPHLGERTAAPLDSLGADPVPRRPGFSDIELAEPSGRRSIALQQFADEEQGPVLTAQVPPSQDRRELTERTGEFRAFLVVERADIDASTGARESARRQCICDSLAILVRPRAGQDPEVLPVRACGDLAQKFQDDLAPLGGQEPVGAVDHDQRRALLRHAFEQRGHGGGDPQLRQVGRQRARRDPVVAQDETGPIEALGEPADQAGLPAPAFAHQADDPLVGEGFIGGLPDPAPQERQARSRMMQDIVHPRHGDPAVLVQTLEVIAEGELLGIELADDLLVLCDAGEKRFPAEDVDRERAFLHPRG